MSPQDPEASELEMMEYSCDHCGKVFLIPYGLHMSIETQWESLKQGPLLQGPCPHCGIVNQTDNIVLFDIETWDIGQFLYVPPPALESDEIRELLLLLDFFEMTYYSIEELVRQVEARQLLLRYVTEELEVSPEYIPNRWTPLLYCLPKLRAVKGSICADGLDIVGSSQE